MLSDSQDGPTTDRYGRDPAHANLSARQAKEKGLLTTGTYGPLGTGSSDSAGLTSSLGSRLRARTALLGSTLFRLTWRVRVTPAGRSYSQLVASARRICENEFGLWPTPCAQDGPKGGPSQGIDRLPGAAALASWPTPMAGTPAQNGNNEAGNNDSSRKTVSLCSWPTPQVTDSLGGGSETAIQLRLNGQRRKSGALVGPKLRDTALLASWATPAAQEPGGTPEQFLDRKEKHPCGQSITALSMQVQLADTGQVPNGSIAETGNGGQLSPAHSRWLMGLPHVWDACGVTAMQSLLKRRRK